MLMIDWVFDAANIYIWWIAYCLLCIPLLYLLLRIMPCRFVGTRYCNIIFLYLLSASIFIFGIIIAAIVLIFLRMMPVYKPDDPYIHTADYPDYQHSPTKRQSSYGEGLGAKITQKGGMSRSMRQKMLIAINQFETPHVNKINTLVLCDDVDEIRLFAKTLIEKQEREITGHLKNIDLRLAATKDTNQIAYYKKLQALILWEQVYRYLVNNENLLSVILRIEQLAKEAFEILKKDAELPLLLVKLAVRRQMYDEAKEWLAHAEKNHAPDYKTIAYHAEINFSEKNYHELGKYLSSVNNTGVIGLQPIISFWAKHD